MVFCRQHPDYAVLPILKGGITSVKPLKEKVSITLDSDLVNRIKSLAEADERSFSQFVNKILKEYVKQTTTSDDPQE